jgi:hypothetical protein
MLPKSPFLIASIAALALFAETASAGTLTFSDTEFATSNWTTVLEFEASPGTGSFAATQVATGGNPGAYRHLDIHDGTVVNELDVASFMNAAVFNPAVQGALTSFDMSFDISDPDLDKNVGAMGFGVLLSQGGHHFFVFSYQQSPDWLTISGTGLTSGVLSNLDGSGTHPDFTTSGGPIQFGLLADAFFFGAESKPCNCSAGGIDNFSVTVHFADAPEPGSVLLMGAGLLALARSACRRRRA